MGRKFLPKLATPTGEYAFELETAHIANGYRPVLPGLTKIRGFGDRQEGFGLWFLRLQSDRWKVVFLESSSWNAH